MGPLSRRDPPLCAISERLQADLLFTLPSLEGRGLTDLSQFRLFQTASSTTPAHSPMAISSKIVTVFIVLSLLSLDLVHAGLGSGSSMAPGQDHKSPAPTPLPPPALDCDAACGVRCSLSSRPNLCKRACGTCCFRCHCVPSGTAGHYEECPCYASQTTHGGVRKCP